MQFFKKLLFLLSIVERKSAFLLLIMIFIMALLETIGVASILPFVAVLTNPSLIETNFLLNATLKFSYIFGIKNNHDFIFALGVFFLSILIISLTFKALTTYLIIRFVYMREYTIGKRLLKAYFGQRYSWFLSHHSIDLGKNILSEVRQVIENGFKPLFELVAKGTVVIFLIILLALVDPVFTFVVSLSLVIIYLSIFYLVRNYLNRIGRERLKNDQLRFATISEALGAIKEIKVGALEENYIKGFSNSAKIFAKVHTSAMIIGQIPRYILEIITFGGILYFILYNISRTGSLNSILPILSLYIFAGYRLMPAIQQVYSSFTQLAYINPLLNKLYNDFKTLELNNKNIDQKVLKFNKTITLKNISYNYPNSSRTTLKDINFTIPSKSKVGFIGPTGSGKTTIVDIILGLLEPKNGTLEVDGKVITNQNIKSWQLSIGYVPQHIYLSEDTIAANIAFGVQSEYIDQDIVKKVSQIAHLHDFVSKELPNQYQTKIGERGVRLSGGQRQRIGIARALYKKPKTLILDEATNALDNQTEKFVMDAINNFYKDITIILISHRSNIIENCDIIFKFDKSQLIRIK
jgi:ABC-type multidrug transport system fused ATPase/permease subunit